MNIEKDISFDEMIDTVKLGIEECVKHFGIQNIHHGLYYKSLLSKTPIGYASMTFEQVEIDMAIRRGREESYIYTGPGKFRLTPKNKVNQIPLLKDPNAEISIILFAHNMTNDKYMTWLGMIRPHPSSESGKYIEEWVIHNGDMKLLDLPSPELN